MEFRLRRKRGGRRRGEQPTNKQANKKLFAVVRKHACTSHGTASAKHWFTNLVTHARGGGLGEGGGGGTNQSTSEHKKTKC